ncbi:EAL domain-containing protein [Thauera sp. CAU 1555]|uniref:EAL domain-containing protein n=1 Tax=Thauera sedimentorum TaxID=2767595 RepID=A0ABR9B8G5_9RHOO|nr:EAL domain-containing protein [Thauera sedimentorum]MBC9071300.1 EAL domain-containing protein [Thauera sedimentorum]MBD8502219.1 EAL domain-containing protein [Thauera sedimentorum]
MKERNRIPQPFAAETLLAKTFDSMDDVVIVVERDSRRILVVNRAFEHTFGYRREEVLGRTTEFLYPDREVFLRGGRESAAAFEHANAFRGTFPMLCRDGTVIQTRHTLSPIYDEQHRLIASVSVIQDRSEWLRTEDRLREQEALLSAVVTNLPCGVFRRMLAPDGTVSIPFFRGALAGEMGIDPEGVSFGADVVIERMHPEDRVHYMERVRKSAATLTPLDMELRTRRASGGYCWVRTVSRPTALADGSVQWDCVAFDISREKAAEERAQRLASFDQLTGLANRRLIRERLEAQLQEARERALNVVIAAINLNRFKYVNTTHGIETGDRILVEVAQRLGRELCWGHAAARLGGDEFLVVLPARAGADSALPLLRRISEVLAMPYRVADETLHLTTSIGVSVYPADGGDAEQLLRSAETALHRARSDGCAQLAFHSPDMSDSMAARASLERALRAAIHGGQLTVHYQPQVDPLTSQLVGLEALVRWQHPERGEILPGEFIAVAEESGLIRPLGRQVLLLVCRQLRAWLDQGLAPVPVSVNLSVKEVDGGLVDQVTAALQAERIEPGLIELEITESSLIGDSGEIALVLRQLRTLGVRFALDDFGTGYSALGYLQRFPFDKLKIDRSFIRDIATDRNQANLVRAIVAMANSLHMLTVAEGIETPAQLRKLVGMGCNIVQGWLYGKAAPAEQITPLLRDGRLVPSPAPVSS